MIREDAPGLVVYVMVTLLCFAAQGVLVAFSTKMAGIW